MNSKVESNQQEPGHVEPVFVFEMPVIIWHWLHTLSFLVLAVTGYFIANPLPSVSGEASDYHLMGNIRFIHFISAYIFAVGFIVRIYWAFVGNRYAREIFYVPVWRKEWWQGVWYEIRFYLFLERNHVQTLGHNNLAQITMFLTNTLMTIFMLLTGFALYGVGLSSDSWADKAFGWVIPLMGGNEAVHNWHNMGMWIMTAFIILHIYMALRADIVGKQSSVSVMVSGWRLFKDNKR